MGIGIFDETYINRNIMTEARKVIMKIVSINRIVSKCKNILFLLTHEHRFQRRLKYLWFREGSDSLLVLFPGFSKNRPRKYNYVKGLMGVKNIDRLYINDNFGHQGSYNLYENGEKKPESITINLIDKTIKKGNYKHLFFAGSSKGGTCAIYFGLVFHADEIFAAACQYHIGKYVSSEMPDNKVFYAMMGKNAGEKESHILDDVMPNLLQKYKGSESVIHIFCSRQDPTYERHIKDLINSLDYFGYLYSETFESYATHSQVGESFLKRLQSRFFHS